MTKDDILKLDISMDNIALMHVVNSLYYFSDYNWGRLFTKCVMLFQQIEKGTITSQLQKQIYIIFITEKVIKLNKVGVIEKGLKFYLSY